MALGSRKIQEFFSPKKGICSPRSGWSRILTIRQGAVTARFKEAGNVLVQVLPQMWW